MVIKPNSTSRPNKRAENVDFGEEHLKALYIELDVLLSGYLCDSSQRCCHFGVTGREPYVSSIEMMLIKRAIFRKGQKLTKLVSGDTATKKKLLISGHHLNTCPFLDQSGKCSIYAVRPFGCRSFFCRQKLDTFRRETKAKFPRKEITQLLQKLIFVSEKYAPGYLSRPLTKWFLF